MMMYFFYKMMVLFDIQDNSVKDMFLFLLRGNAGETRQVPQLADATYVHSKVCKSQELQ